MAKLTSVQRKNLPKRDFAVAGGKYPVPDKSHARNALARVSEFGSSSEKAQVRAKVNSKFPDIGNKSHPHANGMENIPEHRRGFYKSGNVVDRREDKLGIK